MLRLFVSSVIPAPVDRVWKLLRDFNGLPAWVSFVKKSRIEEGKATDQVGCIRNFNLADGGAVREQLLALSDTEYIVSYSILGKPMPLTHYVATIRLRPITELNQTFMEWSVEFDPDAGHEQEMIDHLTNNVFLAAMNDLKKLVKGK